MGMHKCNLRLFWLYVKKTAPILIYIGCRSWRKTSKVLTHGQCIAVATVIKRMKERRRGGHEFIKPSLLHSVYTFDWYSSNRYVRVYRKNPSDLNDICGDLASLRRAEEKSDIEQLSDNLATTGLFIDLTCSLPMTRSSEKLQLNLVPIYHTLVISSFYMPVIFIN